MGAKDSNILDIEKKYSDKFSIILSKLLESDKEYTLEAFLKAKSSFKNIDKITSDITELIDTTVYGCVQYYAVAQYLYMSLSNNWTDAGQDRVKNSFYSCINGLSSDSDLSFSDYESSEKRIQELAVTYKLNDKSEQQLKQIIKEPSFRVFGIYFYFYETEKLNKLFRMIGSARRIIMGLNGDFVTMIFGVANTMKYHTYEIHHFYKEEVRTPNAVNYIVAVIDQNQIAIRKEVCEYIFYKKWVPVAENDSLLFSFMNNIPENQIAETIKQQVMKSFNVNSKDDLLAVKEDFINKMMENFSYHEVSHDILEDFNLTGDEVAIVSAISVLEENMLTVMNEILTEWMPGSLHLKGPLKNILDIAIKNGQPEKAKQMLLMYMSDGWFLDTDTEFMYQYTYVMFAILLKYLNKEEQIDFVTLYAEINDTFDFLLKWYRNTIADIQVLLKQLSYKGSKGGTLSFDDLKDNVFQVMTIMSALEKRKITDKQQLSQNWINFFIQTRSMSPQNIQKVSSLISKNSKNLFVELILKFGGKEASKKYADDIRSYVLDGMTQAGFEAAL